MKNKIHPIRILPDLWLFKDTCNVYLIKRGDTALAVDFGEGAWLKELPSLGVKKLTDVFLTHHHADQCAGLQARSRRGFAVHAPAGERKFLDPAQIREADRELRSQKYVTFPASYHRLPRGVRNVLYDVPINREIYLNGLCLRVVLTPGHGESACSYIVELQGKQVCFCGDAVHAGGTIWEPFNLEWDHWTGRGALAAWEGVRRLAGIGLDVLCPAHGPAINSGIRTTLRRLDRRLMDFYRAKGSVCSGEKDHFVTTMDMVNGVRRVLPHLYAGPGNSYLLHSETGEALIVDPMRRDVEAFKPLLRGTLRGVRPSAALASHAHHDHYAGMPYLQKHYGVKAWWHPRLVEAVCRYPEDLYRMKCAPKIDHVWPATGTWRWHEYVFQVAPWPGQTWWHCVFMTVVDGKKIMFGGDSFQPASRWNGTGGFCAANRSRFKDGFIPSAELALRWHPDIMANGHGNLFYFTPSRFRRIIRWAGFADKAVRAICPSGDLTRHYSYCKEQMKP